jgi:hypothetical protein
MRMIGLKSKSPNPGALPTLWRSVHHGRRDANDSAPGQQESDSDDEAE